MKHKCVLPFFSLLTLLLISGGIYFAFFFSKVTGFSVPEAIHMVPDSTQPLHVSYSFNRDSLSPTQMKRAIAHAQLLYKSSNPKCLSVSEDGILQALAPGAATVTVFSKDGTSVSCHVDISIPITNIQLAASLTLSTMDPPFPLDYKLLPENATNPTVTFSSDDEAVLQIDSHGILTIQKEGETILRVTAPNGVSAECHVQVNKATMHLRLSKESLRLESGRSAFLSVTGDEDASCSLAVLWTSSNSAVASVDETGQIRAISPGTAAITAVNEYGLTAKCEVVVYVPQAQVPSQAAPPVPELSPSLPVAPNASDQIPAESISPTPSENQPEPPPVNTPPDIEYVNPNDIPILPEENL